LMVMDRHDDFFLGWLARDARFQASVHFAPKTKLGYTIHRKVYASMQDEPALNMWLATQGIYGRVLRDVRQITLLLRLLEPVWDAVKDKHNLKKLRITMEATSARKIEHNEMLDLIKELDSY